MYHRPLNWAGIKPVLKKPSADPAVLANYRLKFLKESFLNSLVIMWKAMVYLKCFITAQKLHKWRSQMIFLWLLIETVDSVLVLSASFDHVEH